MKNFYISDWHYGHRNVIQFDDRPFADVNHMNATLEYRWNLAVSPEDTVYALGDMFWCSQEEAEAVLGRLNGKIVLIKGNHDRVHGGVFAKRFSSIRDYAEINDEGRRVVLCHYPIPTFKNHMRGWFHLYGHVHNSKEDALILDFRRRLEREQQLPCRMYNVGCMMPYMDYTPRTLDEILILNGEADI